MSDSLEISLEKRLAKVCKKRGYIYIKLGGYVGIPDRLILAPKARICFVELKKQKGKYGRLQKWWRDRLEALDFKCYKCNDWKQAQLVLKYLNTQF